MKEFLAKKSKFSGDNRMKSKWNLVTSIFQLVIGSLGTVAFVILRLSEENMAKWIPALVLSITSVVLGIIGIIKEYKKD